MTENDLKTQRYLLGYYRKKLIRRYCKLLREALQGRDHQSLSFEQILQLVFESADYELLHETNRWAIDQLLHTVLAGMHKQDRNHWAKLDQES